MKQRIRHLLYFVLLVIVDQVTKYFAQTVLQKEGPFVIIPKVFKLQYHRNNGAVWGIMSGKVDFLVILTIVLIFFLLFLYSRIPTARKYAPMLNIFVFIIAGAIGNFIDRIRLRYVIDFIYFELINFPIFNVADMYLTLSCALLFILGIFYYKEEDFEFIDSLFRRKKSQDKGRINREDE